MSDVGTRAYLLSNGAFSVLMTPRGAGYCALNGHALTRWSPDPTTETHGCFCYLRDVESGRFWSLTEAPRGVGAGRVIAGRDFIELSAHAEKIESSLRISVGSCNAEVRTIQLLNRDTRPRVLELTTYSELALNAIGADAAHLAFSKLFVQTGVADNGGALLAWRRPRSPDDRVLWVGQRLVGGRSLGYETDRARFIGRARTCSDPLAMQSAGKLGGTIGTVLDPVFAQRAACELEPGESSELQLITVAGGDAAEVAQALDAAVTTTPATASAQDALSALGLPSAWLESIHFDAQPHAWTAAAPPASDPVAQPRHDFGAFTEDGSEYVIAVGLDLEPTPQPWINVIANEDFGCLFSERGAGYTWAQNSRENRITPWSNDPVCDPHSEALFIRDQADGAYWSVLPGPTPAPVPYEVRHGFGYSRVRHAVRDLVCDALVFVPRSDPVRIIRVAITNRSGVPRALTLWSYAQLVLGGLPAETRASVRTRCDADAGIMFAQNQQRDEFRDRVAFAAACVPGAARRSATGDRAAFVGAAGMAQPSALRSGRELNGAFGSGYDPCAAQRFEVKLEPGETLHCGFLLGEAESEELARTCIAKYASCAAIDAAAAEAASYWKGLLSALCIATPEPALDLMANGWLAYQDLACRMWARSAAQQSGGAFGFRDQLQDSSALLYLDPTLARDQILLHAAHQFVEGDVLHWWHPPTSKGIRTRFSDDLLWLPYIALFYVESSGDRALLDESARYIVAQPLDEGEDEVFVWPQDSATHGSIYQHCCRAIDRSLSVGAHGLPLMGVGDWNDGMNRVGREGRGESVWLGFFLFDILERFIPVCESRGDAERAERYRACQENLTRALNDTGWDGEWYRRAYYDDGAPLGSRESDECRIDALAQAWAVLSRAAPAERAQSAINAMQAQLVDARSGLIRLLTPPFDRTGHDPGYIKGYLPGVRENGGQYTHAALWAVRALAELGERERAAPLLAMLSPVSHTTSAQAVRVYQGEPYVVAADVYGLAPHIGRAGWTWYTGSAGWMLRTILESVLGFRLVDGQQIRLQPCIPGSWPGFTLRYRLPDGTVFRFVVEQTDRATEVVAPGLAARVEDDCIVVPITRDGALHEIKVLLGRDVAPAYVSIADPLLRTTSE